MVNSEETLRALREAVRISPDNLPLRQHLASTLLEAGKAEEAEKEYRQALAQHADNAQLKLGLAHCFYQQNKDSQSLVVIEDLLETSSPPARALLLHARLLLRGGEAARAAEQYRRAVAIDPSAADSELAERLASSQSASTGPVVEGRQRQGWEEPEELPDGPLERPKISFADVGGMEVVKDEVRMKLIHPLAHPELYAAYGKTVGGGILLYGPPGCGKTHLARATAGEVRASFLAVGINEVLNLWIGESERNLHAMFDNARNNRPCVLFFDEVDALAMNRVDLKHGGSRQLINQFLSEMDGVQASNDGVLVLAATNAPWHLDPAFRRPGRFDRLVFVPPPDVEARAAILRVLCRGKPQEALDFEHLARKTDGFSGADLKAVVDQAIEQKLRAALADGIPRPLTTRDLAAAAAGVKPSTREWFATARNYALYSNQGGVYDDILKYLKL